MINAFDIFYQIKIYIGLDETSEQFDETSIRLQVAISYKKTYANVMSYLDLQQLLTFIMKKKI